MSKSKQEMEPTSEGLRCVDCKYRKPDSVMFGRNLSNAMDCECKWYKDKPVESMWGDCPHYGKEVIE